jgi:hypothetical protein
LTSSTLEKLRLTGGGPPFIRIGARAVGYALDDLDAYIEAGRRNSTSDPGPDTPRQRYRRSKHELHGAGS